MERWSALWANVLLITHSHFQVATYRRFFRILLASLLKALMRKRANCSRQVVNAHYFNTCLMSWNSCSLVRFYQQNVLAGYRKRSVTFAITMTWTLKNVPSHPALYRDLSVSCFLLFFPPLHGAVTLNAQYCLYKNFSFFPLVRSSLSNHLATMVETSNLKLH